MSGVGTNLENTISSGIAGLDDVLNGGFRRNRCYLIEGVPGSGKTTLALQFMRASASRGEPVLYVTLSETIEELRAAAESHGWSLDGVTLREIMPTEEALDPGEASTMFHLSEVELAATTQQVLADVESLRPTSVVIDSLSELRLLAGSGLRYRRQILALKQYFNKRGCTVMLLDDLTATDQETHIQSIAHGVILLEQLNPEYGNDRRRLRVRKYRGVAFRGGYHDYAIRTGGIEVYPRLVAAEYRTSAARQKFASGITELDSLLGGGIEQGTSTLIVGAAGTGKSTLAAQFVAAAAARGQKSAFYAFDESPVTLTSRTQELGIDLSSAVEKGAVAIRQVDPGELSPGEMTHAIRVAVERDDVKLIVIDSLNGYLNSMPEERFLSIQLHELLTYLGQRNVATILVAAHSGLIGSQMSSPVDASYLADAVVLMRYFEARGEVRQALSVMKKRGSRHERTIREFGFDDGRIFVGAALREFRGILTGVPVYEGDGQGVRKGSSGD
ncbi:MAG TPA: ATPase domain-containing protein [Vicinamibacterales bacterium]|nr:ATPase domain-containing protein [Vicinamibacterales bacterium]